MATNLSSTLILWVAVSVAQLLGLSTAWMLDPIIDSFWQLLPRSAPTPLSEPSSPRDPPRDGNQDPHMRSARSTSTSKSSCRHISTVNNFSGLAVSNVQNYRDPEFQGYDEKHWTPGTSSSARGIYIEHNPLSTKPRRPGIYGKLNVQNKASAGESKDTRHSPRLPHHTSPRPWHSSKNRQKQMHLNGHLSSPSSARTSTRQMVCHMLSTDFSCRIFARGKLQGTQQWISFQCTSAQ